MYIEQYFMENDNHEEHGKCYDHVIVLDYLQLLASMVFVVYKACK